ncbi:acyl-CoA dehydrogenase family protein [Amycolatopsis sp.]|uniref:acyl-CoA dehydrogenase family protein n=1 Tax=Amycolatopsis sp. TaxID=37632 RepID=UPI002D7F6F2E|nr:acyl-CoA dehydrogenase family protein [Amycolatopsis sp.]HET6707254.1 acyl-CoA dehydrogenase family protein [Amycolatopsis sp.]
MDMLEKTGSQSSPALLREPVTDEGHGLVELIGARLPEVAAGAADNDRDARFPVDVFTSFGKDGVLGATVPKELGGLGVDRLHDVALGLLNLAKVDASTALALHVQFSRGLTLTYEWRYGTPQAQALAERLLRGMATGDRLVCGAVKDHPSTVTTLTPDGHGDWVLSGRKTLVSMAPVATDFFVYAQWRAEDGPIQLAAPVVSREAPGLDVLDNWDGLGMRASGTLDVVFRDCPVAAGDVLVRGPLDAADDAALAGQTVSSITMLGIYAGIAEAARDIAVRSAGKRAAGASAGVRTLVAEIDARLFALRATAGTALGEADLLSTVLFGDLAERGRRMMRAFQYAKLTVNELGLKIVNDCLTVVGGSSYVNAHPLSRLYRDIRAGWFMQPYTYPDGVDFLSAQALGITQHNDYMKTRAAQAPAPR